MSRKAKRLHASAGISIDDLVEEAIRAKTDLSHYNNRLAELTPAVALAADVWLVVTEQNKSNEHIRTAELLYDVAVTELQKVQQIRDWQLAIVESLRQRDIPQVTNALDDLVIGGITFG